MYNIESDASGALCIKCYTERERELAFAENYNYYRRHPRVV